MKGTSLAVALLAGVVVIAPAVTPTVHAASSAARLEGIASNSSGEAPYNGERVLLAAPLLVMRNSTGLGNNIEVFRSPSPGAEPVHEATIAPPAGVFPYGFGQRLSSDGTTIVADGQDPDTGLETLYLFEKVASSWEVVATLPMSGGYLYSLSLSDGLLLATGPIGNSCCPAEVKWLERAPDGTWTAAVSDVVLNDPTQLNELLIDGNVGFVGPRVLYKDGTGWHSTYVGSPANAVAFSGGRLVIKLTNGDLQVFDVDATTHSLSFVAQGTPPGPYWASSAFAVDGDRVYVARRDQDATGIEVLEVSGQQLLSVGVIAPPQTNLSEFGGAVGMFGDTVVVPAKRGPAVIYGFDSADLTVRWGIQDDALGAYASSGTMTAVSGDHMAANATVFTGLHPHIAIDMYVHRNGAWQLQEQLEPISPTGEIGSVRGLAMDGGRLVATAFFDSSPQNSKILTWELDASGNWVLVHFDDGSGSDPSQLTLRGDRLQVYPGSISYEGFSYQLTTTGWVMMNSVFPAANGRTIMVSPAISPDGGFSAVSYRQYDTPGNGIQIFRWAAENAIPRYVPATTISIHPSSYVGGIAWVDNDTLVVGQTGNPFLSGGLTFYDIAPNGTTSLIATVPGTGMGAGGNAVTSANGVVYASRAFGYSSDPGSYNVDVIEQTATGWAISSTIEAPEAIGNALVAQFGRTVIADAGHLAIGAPYATPGAVVGAGGVAMYSISDTEAPPTGPPSPPTGISVVAGNHSATITWLKPANDGGTPIIGYTVTATPGGQTCSTDSADVLSCTIYGLTNGVNYSFRVTARNAAGESTPSDPPQDNSGNPTPIIIGTPPDPVVVLPPVPDPVDGTKVTVYWLAAASDPDLPIIGYTATASPGGQSCSTTGELFCTITGLDPSVSYSFTVVAINGIGPSPTTVPDAPTVISAGNGAYRQAIVSWSAPASNGGSPISGYTVTANDGSTCSTSGVTSCNISGLVPGQPYTFTVVATNGRGDSLPSEPSAPLIVALDSFAPSITASVSPAAPDGQDGWYRTQPTVSFTCSDAETGVASCTGPVIVTDGTDQAVGGTAVDTAGNRATATVSGLNVDTTSPVVTLTYTATSTPPVTCVATDSGSGLSGPCQVSAPTQQADGSFKVTGTAIDRAGNAATGEVSYTIPTTNCQTVAGWITQLSSLALAGDKAQSRSKAVESLNKSLTRPWWNATCTAPKQPDGKKVFNEFHDAVQQLAKITGNAAVAQIYSGLLAMSRQWAVDAIATAPSRGIAANKITQAQQQLALGDQKAGQNNPGDAVDAYRQAWDKSTS